VNTVSNNALSRFWSGSWVWEGSEAPWYPLDSPLDAQLADMHVSHADVHCKSAKRAKRFDPARPLYQLYRVN